jgi:hypothetical protein
MDYTTLLFKIFAGLQSSYVICASKPAWQTLKPTAQEFPKTFTIIGNIVLAAWIVIDIIPFLLYNLVAGVVFLLVVLIAVYGVLKFLGCLHPCYNCKKCTFGLGRLAALYFGKRSLKDYKYTYHLPTALFFYTLIGPFPAAIAIVSAVQAFTVLKAAVAILLVALTIYGATTWRQTEE